MDDNKSNNLVDICIRNNTLFLIKIFDLQNEDDAYLFDKVLYAHAGVEKIDNIKAQLIDLIKIKNPDRKLTEKELEEKIQEHIGDIPMEIYGRWIYYPWRHTIVHMLDKDEFIAVKTNRNRNKITDEEQALLVTKKIGVIGLSVGSSVATTVVMERLCGEVRLADFDSLDLSNCNRLRTSVCNIGVPKVIITAREILELDPYIDIRVFEQGITRENIDDFINEGGKLDIIIEECDSLDVKLLSRIKAKEYGVPLIMEMSDKGMIDVERYDLDSDYKMFHGKIEHLDLSPDKLQNLSMAEKVQYMYPMVGGENISQRLLASAAEVGKTILTWPQLASAVVLGGGISADVTRRIFLNQFTKSGRYYVDLEQLISNN